MVTKQRKQEIVAELKEQIQNANCFYFIDYTKMPVKLMENLRNQLREKSTTMRVAKNTLITRAFNEVEGVELPFEKLQGMTALITSNDDPLAAAKILKAVVDKSKMPAFKGAIVEGQFFGADELKALAEMPSKPEIIASILGSLNAPISGIVGSINAVIRDVASLVEEVAKKQAGVE